VAGLSVKANGAIPGHNYSLTIAAGTNSGSKFTVTDNTTGISQVVDNVGTPTAGTKDVAFSAMGLTFTLDSTFVAPTGTATTTSAVNVTAGSSDFQVGADNTADNRVTVDLSNSYTTTSLYGAYTGTATTGLTTQADAQNYIDKAKAALDKLVTQRADLGATQNQLSYVQANLATSIEQTTASVSNIRDADIAAEMANFTKSQILVQAGTAMLAQANQVQQNVLRLFR
jgi:flagellin